MRLRDWILSFPGINTSSHTKAWFQMQAVLRVSMGNFLFFGILALIMIGVKDQNDRRDSWQHGGWVAKMVIWLLLVVLMFFIPNVVISIYGPFFQISHFSFFFFFAVVSQEKYVLKLVILGIHGLWTIHFE